MKTSDLAAARRPPHNCMADRLEYLLLGSRPWGTWRCIDSPNGFETHELMVYPPGIRPLQRWALSPAAPLLGIALGVVLCAAFHKVLPVMVSLMLLLGPAVLLTLAAERITRPVRPGLHALAVTIDHRAQPPRVAGDPEVLAACRRRLRELDHGGPADPARYQRIWREVYEAAAPPGNTGNERCPGY